MVGQQLKAIRLDRNMTQMELAALAGVGQKVISDLERGQARASFVTCVRIARALVHTNPLDIFPLPDPAAA